jgi:hypothetical protein
MTIIPHNTNIAEVTSETLVISKIEDGIDLLGNLYYLGFDKIILHEENITPDFFVLSTGIAGEILQKFSTYRVRLVIVGDFSKYTSKSLRDFIYESNKGKHICFVANIEDAIVMLSKKQ